MPQRQHLNQGCDGGGIVPVILEDLLATRCLYVFGVIDSQSVCSAIAMLHSMVAMSSSPIHIFVCSYGGEIECGYGLVDTIETLSTICPIHITAVGAAMSMGAILVAHGTHGFRYATVNTTFMLHDFSNALEHDYVSHQAVGASFLSTDFDRKQEILASHLKVGVAKLKKMMRTSCWLSASQAKEIGLIDDVILAGRENPWARHIMDIRSRFDERKPKDQ